MGSFTPCQPVYLYIFQTFFCEMTKRQQLKQQQQEKNVATQIGQFWTPIMCDWTANFRQIILKHSGKKYFLNQHQECNTLRIKQDIPLGSCKELIQNRALLSGLAARPRFCLRAQPCKYARRHAHAHDRLKPGLAMGLPNKALYSNIITNGQLYKKKSAMQKGEGSKVGHNLPTDGCKNC